MSDEMSLAVSLLGVGMVTVILVLSLVVGLGKLMIRIVNLLPEAPVQGTSANIPAGLSDSSKIAAITAAVAHITGGKAVITKIDKQK